MGNKTWKVLGVIGLYAVLAWNSPVTAKSGRDRSGNKYNTVCEDRCAGRRGTEGKERGRRGSYKSLTGADL